MRWVGEGGDGFLFVDDFADFAVLSFFAVLQGAAAVDGGVAHDFGDTAGGVVGGAGAAIGVGDVVGRERGIAHGDQAVEVVVVVDRLTTRLQVRRHFLR